MSISLPLAHAPARGSLLKDRAACARGGQLCWEGSCRPKERVRGMEAAVAAAAAAAAAAPEKPVLSRGKAVRTDRLLEIHFHL